MALKRFPVAKKSGSNESGNGLNKAVLRQALDLFLFSSAFAVVFNLFYYYGIELKVPPPNIKGVMGLPTPEAVPTWPGLKPHSTTPIQAVSKSTPVPSDPFTRVSLMGAKERFDKGTAIFLDARPVDEYKEGHIPGSLNFYADEFDKFYPLVIPKLPDKDREIIAYCHGSSCELSVVLARRLTDLGFTKVKVFFGGWPEWKKAAYPIQKGEAP